MNFNVVRNISVKNNICLPLIKTENPLIISTPKLSAIVIIAIISETLLKAASNIYFHIICYHFSKFRTDF